MAIKKTKAVHKTTSKKTKTAVSKKTVLKKTTVRKKEAAVKTSEKKKPVVSKIAAPLAQRHPVSAAKPAPPKESKFEVVIPKYKAKVKLHAHIKTYPGHAAKPAHETPQAAIDVSASISQPAGLLMPAAQAEEIKLRCVEIDFPVSVKDLAGKIQVKPNDIISRLLKKGVIATINQLLQEESAGEIAREFAVRLTKAPTIEEQLVHEHEKLNLENLVGRSPVVTLMGHVDHGKTSLLDAIRQTNVAEREAGGITQHIGAYRVKIPKGVITFLDTPGHEAFTAMRARGATATDIVILVVAADDGVMPQTIEAIDHAKAAAVPIVVALNKIDKPTADPDMVKKQLSQYGLLSEDWGGKTVIVGVSAKTKQGIDTLLEMVLLEAEMLELRANLDKPASGVVIESRLSRGQGPAATLLVENGTLMEGDNVIIGSHYGKMRSMINDRGEKVAKALPSVPVEISGISGVPQAGEKFYVIKDEKKAKDIFQHKQMLLKQERPAPIKRITLEDIYAQIKEGRIKELKIILKTDVRGSLQALEDSLVKMSTDEVKLNVIHNGIGIINDADVILAAASDAIIIGFNVAISPEADERIKKEGVDVRLYRIIYDVTSDIKSAMEGLLEPKIEEVFEGRAQVKQVFEVSKVGVIAGCIIQKGAIGRTDSCRLIRDGKEIFKGKISSLKRFKDDVKEVKEGFECGIGLADFKGIQSGDIIEAFTIKKSARKL